MLNRFFKVAGFPLRLALLLLVGVVILPFDLLHFLVLPNQRRRPRRQWNIGRDFLFGNWEG